MEILQAVTKAEEMAKKILSDRTKETAELEAKVKQEAIAIEEANKAMEVATIAGNVKAYQKAKADRRDAADAKEMHDARLNALNHKPLISKADYEKAVAEIYAEIAGIDDKAKQNLTKLSEQMEAEILELQEDIKKANEVLHLLQHNVYRDADRKTDAQGEPLFLPHEDKKIEKWETINWGKAGVMHPQYTRYTGRKVQ